MVCRYCKIPVGVSLDNLHVFRSSPTMYYVDLLLWMWRIIIPNITMTYGARLLLAYYSVSLCSEGFMRFQAYTISVFDYLNQRGMINPVASSQVDVLSVRELAYAFQQSSKHPRYFRHLMCIDLNYDFHFAF